MLQFCNPNGSVSTSVPDMSTEPWTLPRAKKVSPGHFFILPTVGPLSLSSIITNKKERIPDGILSFYGVDNGTRTPDLLLRSIGQGIFGVISCPFDALWWGNLRVIFSLAAFLPYQFFLFWVRIWVKLPHLVAKMITRRLSCISGEISPMLLHSAIHRVDVVNIQKAET